MTDAADYPSCVHGRKVFEHCPTCLKDARAGRHGGFERAPQPAADTIAKPQGFPSSNQKTRAPGSGNFPAETALMVLCSVQNEFGSIMSTGLRKDIHFAIELLRQVQDETGCVISGCPHPVVSVKHCYFHQTPVEKAAPVALNGHQIRAIVQFLGGEFDTEISIGYFDAVPPSHELNLGRPAGYYVWCTEYPEEGSWYLNAAREPFTCEHGVPDKTTKLCMVCLHNILRDEPTSPKTSCKPLASTDDGASPSRPSPSSVECPKCRTQLAFEGDECGLCKEEA